MTRILIFFLYVLAFSAILCGGLFGVVGKFPSTYIAAVVSGQALGGIFAALIEIISLTFAVSAITSAFIYFMVANITLLFSIIAYVVLSKSLFFKYHTIDKVIINILSVDHLKPHKIFYCLYEICAYDQIIYFMGGPEDQRHQWGEYTKCNNFRWPKLSWKPVLRVWFMEIFHTWLFLRKFGYMDFQYLHYL